MLLTYELALAAEGLDLAQLLTEAKGQQEWLITHRRHLHQWPELLFEEQNTSAYIRKQLEELAVPYKYAPVLLSGLHLTTKWTPPAPHEHFKNRSGDL